MVWIFMLVGILVGFVLALGSCRYREAQLWKECCILEVYTDETSSSEAGSRSSSWVSPASSMVMVEDAFSVSGGRLCHR
jgi:hypothetical protein